MELSDLRYFLAVIDEGGVSSAAKKLNRVPSNITARIKKLESHLDTQLFIRDGNRLRVSPSGQQLSQSARELLLQAERAVMDIKGSKPSGLLRVGSIEMAAATRLVEPVMDFHHRYPDVDLQLHAAPTGKLIERVLNGELDIALVSDPMVTANLEQKPVFKETLVLISDRQHQDIKRPEDLGTNPTILGFSHLCSYRKRFDKWLKQDQLIARTIDIHSYHALLSCVTAGMGVGIIPESVLDIFPYKHAIKQHALPLEWRHSNSCLIWRSNNLTANAKAFKQGLLQALDQR